MHLPVLHSVSYAGAWPGQAFLTVPEFLTKAVALGYPAVALAAKAPHVSPSGYTAESRRELKSRIGDLGLQLAAMMGYTDFACGLHRPGIPSAEINAEYVARLCELSADLGTRYLRIFTGYRFAEHAYDLQYGEVFRGLQLAGEYARQAGIILILQNHHDIAAHYREFAWLLRELGHPHIKAAFDCWALWLHGARGEELCRAVHELAPWTEFTTVADYKVMPQYSYRSDRVNYQQEISVVRATQPGEGELDYGEFFRGLRETGYRGPVAYEMCAPLEGGGSVENLDRTALAFLRFLRDQTEAAGD